MVGSSENKPAPKKWRFPLAMGASIGVGMATARAVESNFESSLGHWGAFLLGLIAAGATAALVSFVIFAILKRTAGDGTV
jgi:hypothetical protein